MTDETSKARREATLGRIRALIAKTVKNGCTEAEAKAAAVAVDRLMALYEIDLDEITVKEQEIVQRVVPDVARHPVRYTFRPVALFTDCKYWLHDDKDVLYFGFQSDAEIAEYLVMLFKRALDRESMNFSMMNRAFAQAGKQERAEQLRSFQIGMAVRLGERLRELKSKRDFTQKTSGKDLMLIKTPLVEQAFEALGIKLGASRSSAGTVRHTASYGAGREAAEKVRLSQGIAARGAVGGRIK
jgi:uncharacterized protein DUF2786